MLLLLLRLLMLLSWSCVVVVVLLFVVSLSYIAFLFHVFFCERSFFVLREREKEIVILNLPYYSVSRPITALTSVYTTSCKNRTERCDWFNFFRVYPLLRVEALGYKAGRKERSPPPPPPSPPSLSLVLKEKKKETCTRPAHSLRNPAKLLNS